MVSTVSTIFNRGIHLFFQYPLTIITQLWPSFKYILTWTHSRLINRLANLFIPTWVCCSPSVEIHDHQRTRYPALFNHKVSSFWWWYTNPCLYISIASWCSCIIKFNEDDKIFVSLNSVSWLLLGRIYLAIARFSGWSSWQQCLYYFILMVILMATLYFVIPINNLSRWARNSINYTWSKGIFYIFVWLQMLL